MLLLFIVVLLFSHFPRVFYHDDDHHPHRLSVRRRRYFQSNSPDGFVMLRAPRINLVFAKLRLRYFNDRRHTTIASFLEVNNISVHPISRSYIIVDKNRFTYLIWTSYLFRGHWCIGVNRILNFLYRHLSLSLRLSAVKQRFTNNILILGTVQICRKICYLVLWRIFNLLYVRM